MACRLHELRDYKAKAAPRTWSGAPDPPEGGGGGAHISRTAALGRGTPNIKETVKPIVHIVRGITGL